MNTKVNFKNPEANASWGQINKASFNLNALSKYGEKQKTYRAMREVIKFLVYDEAVFFETETYELKDNYLTMKDIQKLIEAQTVPVKIDNAFNTEIKKKTPTTKRKPQSKKLELSQSELLKALGLSSDDLKILKTRKKKTVTKSPLKKRI
jgi:hypothetical protein